MDPWDDTELDDGLGVARGCLFGAPIALGLWFLIIALICAVIWFA